MSMGGTFVDDAEYGVNTVLAEADANGNTIYIGQAVAGTLTNAAAWQIVKVTYDANGYWTGKLYANGTDGFTNVWDNRASYSYT